MRYIPEMLSTHWSGLVNRWMTIHFIMVNHEKPSVPNIKNRTTSGSRIGCVLVSSKNILWNSGGEWWWIEGLQKLQVILFHMNNDIKMFYWYIFLEFLFDQGSFCGATCTIPIINSPMQLIPDVPVSITSPSLFLLFLHNDPQSHL